MPARSATSTQAPSPRCPTSCGCSWLSNGTVTNKEPTTGGKSIPQKLVTQDDYDRALAELNTRLQTELARQAATPTGHTRGWHRVSRDAAAR